MNMNNILIMALCFALFLPVAARANQIPLPRLHVKGNGFVTPAGESMTLRGVSLCSLSWHDPMALLKDLGRKDSGWNVNVVRLPVQPQEWKRLGPENN